MLEALGMFPQEVFFNNAMRLGQGFNSYTHQICVDDAVTITDEQPENVLTNDANTMRLAAMILGHPSAWVKQEPVLSDDTQFDIAKEGQARAAAAISAAETEASTGVAAADPAAADHPGGDHMAETPVESQADTASAGDSADADGPGEQPATETVPQAQADLTPATAGGHSGEDSPGDAGVDDGIDVEAGATDGPGEPEENPKAESGTKEDTSLMVQESADTISESPEKDQESAPPAPTDENRDAAVVQPSENTAIKAGGNAEAKADTAAKVDVKAKADAQAKAEAAAASKLKADRKALELAQQQRKRRAETQAAANAYKANFSLEKMAAMHKKFLMPKSKYQPADVGSKTKVFQIENSSGVSQTVVYCSQLIEKLSEATSNMGISAGLSIKKGTIGGGGRGSFLSSERFKDSDLNYFISVKVINQSINFKDALKFNNLENVAPEDFRSVFGDCFISGFLEGGELNAMISMKILNKVKSSDIKAEASVALGKGSLGIDASGAFQTAKANLDLNTETTVQVEWIGGGVIKRRRRHGRSNRLLYETLRSYQLQQRPEVTEIDYKNAISYTNELLDVFMTYKALYGRLTTQINEVQAGRLKFRQAIGEEERKRPELVTLTEEEKKLPLPSLTDAQKKSVIGYFSESLDGLDDARSAVRTQMNCIIQKVDEIAKDPSVVLKSAGHESFLRSFAFETLLPTLESAFRSSKRMAEPLTGQRMFGEKEDDDDEGVSGEVARLCLMKKAPVDQEGTAGTKKGKTPLILFADEQQAIKNERIRPTPGTFFTALDFVQDTFLIRSVAITINEGVVAGLSCRYANGMAWTRGEPSAETKLVLNLNLKAKERITSAIVTVGTENVHKSPEHVLALKLVTNRGNTLMADCPDVRRAGFNKRFIGSRPFINVRTVTFESPIERGYVIGFWGRSDQGEAPAIRRLGIVWSSQNPVEQAKADALAQDEKARAARETDRNQDVTALDAMVVNLKLSQLETQHKQLQLDSEKRIAELEAARRTPPPPKTDLAQTQNKAQGDLEALKAEKETSLRELRQTVEAEKSAILKNALEKEKKAKSEYLKTLGETEARRTKDLESASARFIETETKAKVFESRMDRVSQALEDTLKARHIRLRHRSSGKVIDTDDEADRNGIIWDMYDTWKQKIYTEPQGNGYKLYNLEGSIRRYARQHQFCNGNNDCRYIKFSTGSSSEGDLFFFTPVPGADGYFHIRLDNPAGWAICTYGFSNGNGAHLCSFNQMRGDNSQWSFH
ncbi:hypothetical protein V8E36_003107 [Tilletia maclaganii]